MASQLRVNKSENRSGLGTITYTDTGAIVSGIVTANSFSGDIIGNITGAVTATTGSFSGDVSIAEKIIHTGDTNTFMKFDTDTVTFETAGDERLRITSAGLVGIGTDAPGSMLHLVSASSPTIRLQDTTNNCLALLFSQNSNAHLGTFSAHPLIFDTNSISRIKINTATGSNNAEIKLSTNDSSTDYLKWGNNPRLWLRCPDGINGLRIDSNTTPLDIRSSDANSRSISIGGSPNFDMSISGDYSLSSGGHDSSPKVFLNATRHNGSSTVTSFQTSIQAVSLSNTGGDGYLGLGASASPDDINILTNGKVFIGPYSAGDDFSDAGSFLNLKNDSYGGRIAFSSNAGGVGATLMEQFAYWGNNKVAGIIATGGGDNNNKDDGELRFYTRHSGQGAGLRVRITRHGAVCFGVQDHANNALDSISGFSGTRNVNILSFPTTVSPWSSWVGTNLYHDGTNFVKHSDHLGQNWGNISGIKFDGANHAGAIGMRFIVDLPAGNAGGDVSIGSAVSAVDNKSAMNIYATGAIVQPKQPRFLAYRGSTDHSVTGSGLITAWNNVKYDVGSNFSSGTKFTAPVTGTYMFGCNIRWGCNGKIRVIRVQLDHYNSSNGGKGNYGGGVGGANDYDGGSGYDHPYTSFTNLVEMDAGDYVQIHLQEVAFSGSLFLQSQGFTSNFWGCLMF